ncbi:MAG: ABC transporter permease [Thermoplasmata archaeon]|nr:ABC transporter permease [Thermoplasmata archaeon]
MIEFLRAVKGRAYPRVIGALREPSWMLWDTFLPLLSLSAYVFVYRSLHAPREFEGFVILGGIMTAYWLNVLWGMASQFYWEKETGNLQYYIMAPASLESILAGMALGGMFGTTTRAIGILLLGTWLFKVDMSVTNPYLLLLIFVICLAAMYAMGMMFSSLFLLWGREAWVTSSLFEEPIYFLSGQNFPVKALGPYLSMAASIIPLTLGLDAMRQLIFPSSIKFALMDPYLELIFLSILTIVYLFLAKVFLRKMENIGKTKGTILTRWL